MNDRKAFGARIREMREKRSLTVDEVSELCDASVSIWKQYERGDRLPSIDKLVSMCLVLKVKPEFILGSELDGLQDGTSDIEKLKLKIEQLTPDEIAIIDAAVSKRLELNKTR